MENIDEIAELLSLLGNKNRLAVISFLLEKELSVGAIAEKVGLSQSALSQHLAKLRDFDLVATRRERQTIYYSCKSDRVKQLLDALNTIYGAEI